MAIAFLIITPRPSLEAIDEEFHTSLEASRLQPQHFIRGFLKPQVYDLRGQIIQTDFFSTATRISKEDQSLMYPSNMKSWTETFTESMPMEGLEAKVTAYNPHELVAISGDGLKELPEGKYEPYFFVSASNDYGYYTWLIYRGTRNLYPENSAELSQKDRDAIKWILETYNLNKEPAS